MTDDEVRAQAHALANEYPAYGPTATIHEKIDGWPRSAVEDFAAKLAQQSAQRAPA